MLRGQLSSAQSMWRLLPALVGVGDMGRCRDTKGAGEVEGSKLQLVWANPLVSVLCRGDVSLPEDATRARAPSPTASMHWDSGTSLLGDALEKDTPLLLCGSS
ncbi:hypothetical protein J3E72DRAFT_273758 [Bipolaris maydis]|nr:hypothetical protein J3E72DRAFT_273758 [Bipolaris maydis]